MKMKEITKDTKLYLVYRGSKMFGREDKWYSYPAKIDRLNKSSIYVQRDLPDGSLSASIRFPLKGKLPAIDADWSGITYLTEDPNFADKYQAEVKRQNKIKADFNKMAGLLSLEEKEFLVKHTKFTGSHTRLTLTGDNARKTYDMNGFSGLDSCNLYDTLKVDFK